MAAGDIVRRVLIQTEVEHVGSTGRAGSPMGGSSRPAGVRRPAGGVSGNGAKRPAGAVSQASKQNAKARNDLLQKEQRVWVKMHDERIRGYQREARSHSEASKKIVDSFMAATNGLMRTVESVKFASHVIPRSQRDAADIMSARNARLFGEQQMRDRMFFRQAPGSQFVRSAPQRLDTGPQFARFRQQQGGGFRARSDYFSTGIPLLDKANQVGFQAFITMMTVRMIASAVSSALENFSGISGEGDTFIAQIVRSARGESRAIRDPINQWWQRTAGGTQRAFGFDELAERSGYGRRPSDLISRGQGLSSELQQLAQGRMTAFMREEDRLIEKRREILQEEENVLNKRLMAAEAEIRRANEREHSARHAFGRMSREDQQRTLDIAGKVARGAKPGDLTKEERQFIDRNRTIFSRTAERFENISAFEGGFSRFQHLGIFNPEARGDFDFVQAALRAKSRRNQIQERIGEIKADKVFEVQLNIERLELEASKLAEQMADALQPQIEDLYQQVLREAREEIARIQEDNKLGRDR